MIDEASVLIDRGLFSNLSDLVRSGIRKEFKENQHYTATKRTKT